jgi:hypothetical protein
MKTRQLTFILLLFFSLNSFAQEQKNAVEKIMEIAPELSEFPDSSYLLSNENFIRVNDSVFIKKVFFPNLGLYYDKNTKINEDFSLNGISEYNVLPGAVYKKNKPSVKIIGKITKANYTYLFARYYDVNSVRCYVMTLDKDLNTKASVCFFAYYTVDSDDVYQSKDKIYFSPFIQYLLKEDSLNIVTKGFLDINYFFEIQKDGRINLVRKVQLDEDYYSQEENKKNEINLSEDLFILEKNINSNYVKIIPLNKSNFELPDSSAKTEPFKTGDFNADGNLDVLVYFGACGTGGCMYGLFLNQKDNYYKLAFWDYLKNPEFKIEKNGFWTIESSEEVNPYDPSKLQISIFKFDREMNEYKLDTKTIK